MTRQSWQVCRNLWYVAATLTGKHKRKTDSDAYILLFCICVYQIKQRALAAGCVVIDHIYLHGEDNLLWTSRIFSSVMVTLVTSLKQWFFLK